MKTEKKNIRIKEIVKAYSLFVGKEIPKKEIKKEIDKFKNSLK